MSENILNKLANIDSLTIDAIIEKSYDDNYKTDMLKTRYSNKLSVVEIDSIIDVDNYKELFYNWLDVYAIDFKKYFYTIDSRNEYETIEKSDSEETINLKNINYHGRLESIKQYKIDFVKYLIKNIKIFKGTIHYIVYVLDMYMWLRYYSTPKCDITNILSSGFTEIGSRYKIITTETNHFGSGLTNDTVFTSISNIVINTQNQVVELYPVNVIKIGIGGYSIQSYVSENEWNTVLKDLVVPIGWNVKYKDISIVSEDSIFYSNTIVLKNEPKNDYTYKYANIKDVMIGKAGLVKTYIY